MSGRGNAAPLAREFTVEPIDEGDARERERQDDAGEGVVMGPVTVGRLGAEDVGSRINVAERASVSERRGDSPAWVAVGELVQVRHEGEHTTLTLNVGGGFLELRLPPDHQVSQVRMAPRGPRPAGGES